MPNIWRAGAVSHGSRCIFQSSGESLDEGGKGKFREIGDVGGEVKKDRNRTRGDRRDRGVGREGRVAK